MQEKAASSLLRILDEELVHPRAKPSGVLLCDEVG
jgi:hypothetical protein